MRLKDQRVMEGQTVEFVAQLNKEGIQVKYKLIMLNTEPMMS